jgi:hypothetical protein
LVGGCAYGFAGGGLPANIKTVAVLPFDNETAMPDLQRELTETLRRELQRRLGLRDAPEQRANAVVRGRILRYDPDIPIGFSANPSQATSARRQLQITVDIAIVDQASGKTLLERRNLMSSGEYAESAEPAGRTQAIEKLVTEIIQGVQSQW